MQVVLCVCLFVVVIFACLLSERVFAITLKLLVLLIGIWCFWGIKLDEPVTLRTLLKLGAGFFLFATLAHSIKHDREVNKGLHQWPNPQGPYYDKWMSLPEVEGGDYYEWLAKQKNWQEPWITWAKLDK